MQNLQKLLAAHHYSRKLPGEDSNPHTQTQNLLVLPLDDRAGLDWHKGTTIFRYVRGR